MSTFEYNAAPTDEMMSLSEGGSRAVNNGLRRPYILDHQQQLRMEALRGQQHIGVQLIMPRTPVL